MKSSFALLLGLTISCTPAAIAQNLLTNSIPTTTPANPNFQLDDVDAPTTLGQIKVSQGQMPASPTSHFTDFETQERFATAAQFEFGGKNGSETFTIEPRFSRERSSDSGLSSYSAEIRLGNFMTIDKGRKGKGWYVFAATDGEALSFKPGAIGGDTNMSVSLTEQIVIGDVQAGVSTFIGDTQLTISYMESEAKYSAPGGISNSKTEGFAGISLAKNF